MKYPTLGYIRVLASTRGFSLTLDDTVARVVHTQCEQIHSSLHLSN